jgi:hypothetical protein
MDIAVNLVENYLRLTGYMTLSEFEVQRRDKKGRFKTVTDVDVMGIRFPGEIYLGDPHREADCELLVTGKRRIESRHQGSRRPALDVATGGVGLRRIDRAGDPGPAKRRCPLISG